MCPLSGASRSDVLLCVDSPVPDSHLCSAFVPVWKPTIPSPPPRGRRFLGVVAQRRCRPHCPAPPQINLHVTEAAGRRWRASSREHSIPVPRSIALYRTPFHELCRLELPCTTFSAPPHGLLSDGFLRDTHGNGSVHIGKFICIVLFTW